MSEMIKYELEFPIKASPYMLYQYISSASSLSEWFADNVNSRGKVFSFFWDGSEEKAELLSSKNNKFVKFKWLDNDENSFFEICDIKYFFNTTFHVFNFKDVILIFIFSKNQH